MPAAAVLWDVKLSQNNRLQVYANLKSFYVHEQSNKKNIYTMCQNAVHQSA